jgi:hypothetical protein
MMTTSANLCKGIENQKYIETLKQEMVMIKDTRDRDLVVNRIPLQHLRPLAYPRLQESKSTPTS